MCLYISGGAALVNTLRCGCHEIQSVSRTLRDYDYGVKVRLRSLIAEYGDFRIFRSLNKKSQTVD